MTVAVLAVLVMRPGVLRGAALDWGGSVSAAVSRAVADSVLASRAVREELRLRLEADLFLFRGTGFVRGDLIHDFSPHDAQTDLRRGTGFVDLREAWLELPLTGQIALRAGRQSHSWGVGDLYLINDPFPKDWAAFVSGYGESFFKRSADVVLLSWFAGNVNVDLACFPWLIPDRIPDGQRLPYWNPLLMREVGTDHPMAYDLPPVATAHTAWATRIYGTGSGAEWGIYLRRGPPSTGNEVALPSGRLGYRPTSSVGASLRFGLGREIIYGEGVWSSMAYDASHLPLTGETLTVLAGIQHFFTNRTSLTVQTVISDHRDRERFAEQFPANLPRPTPTRADHLLRFESLAHHADIRLTVLVLGSNTARDYLVLPRLAWRLQASWILELGLMVAGGEAPATRLGQLARADNAHLVITRHF